MKFSEFTALEMGAKIKEGEVSVVEFAQETLGAIAQQDAQINAFITPPQEEIFLEKAQEVQKKIEEGSLTSPLAGVFIGVKDNICVKDMPLTCASKIMGDFSPAYSATAVEKLCDSGLLVAGKLNLDEFAMGSSSQTSYFGPVKNPWNTQHVPGGSSGGSVAAVASGQLLCALGTDTGGSIRQPASHCGVTGFKPTYGVVSRYGAVAYASSLDQIGPIAQDAADCAALLDIIAGHDPRDGSSLNNVGGNYLSSLDGNIAGKRIALARTGLEDNINPEVQAAIEQVAQNLKEQGAVVEEIDLSFFEYAIAAYYAIATAEASSSLARFDGVKYGWRAPGANSLEEVYKKTRSEGFGREVTHRILLGNFVLSAEQYEAYYKKALQLKGRLMAQFDEIFKSFDGILSPSALDTAPPIGGEEFGSRKSYLADVFLAPANLAGLPALTIPAGFDQKGLPIGAQLIGNRLEDAMILNLGHAFQQQTAHHKKKPAGGVEL